MTRFLHAKPLLLPSLILLTSACGALIGNPGNNSVEGDTAATSDGSGSLSLVSYDIPDTVSGYSLTEDLPDGLFTDSALRIDKTLDQINKVLKDLNNSSVGSVGTFTDKGPSGNVSGSIEAISVTNDQGYDFTATICSGGKVFQWLEWSSTNGHVHTIRNHAVDPIETKRTRNSVSEVVFTNGDSPNIEVWLYEVADKTVPGADGNILAEHVLSTKTGEQYVMSGLHNWYKSNATVNDEGDEYFVGTFNEAGVGEYVGYNAFRPGCSASFDETADQPSWCTGRSLEVTTQYTSDERVAAWTRLKSIGILSKTSLKIPALPSDLSCP